MKTWTPKEEIELIELVKSGFTTEEIATKLNRSYKSVQHRRANIYRGGYTPVKPKEEKPIKQKELATILMQALNESLENVQPYKAAIQSKKDAKGDSLVIQISDLHAGKIVKNQEGEIIYNEEIFRLRINRLCEQTLKLLDNNISKGVPITDVVVLLNGDLCNGENIYATQAYEQEATPPSQVMLVVDVITKLIVSLLQRKLPVKVYGIRGNHGRTGKDTDVASNWDLMVYKILDFWARTILNNSNLQIKYSETEHMVFNIKGHNIMLRHIAPEQVDSPAGRVKINEWARLYNLSAVCYGHFHHAAVSDCDNVRVIRAGSTVGGDSLSDSMAKHSEPMQVVFGVTEQRITTFIYFVDLGDKNA